MERKKIIGTTLIALSIVYLLNASWLAPRSERNLQLLAHRGLHQTFEPAGVSNDTCTAYHIHPPTHQYIENTLSSMHQALKMGADIIEFDIHPTIDGEFVVFHDWELECRTNGKGVVREQTISYLKTLDVGYGYTADSGRSYPFRGKFIGKMPTLNEVLTEFPQTEFWVNIKSKSNKEVEALTHYLAKNKTLNRKKLTIYGAAENIDLFNKLNPDMKTFSMQQAKDCIKSYIIYGWLGLLPDSCHNNIIAVPVNYQWLIWGWPKRFEARLKTVNSRAVIIGPLIKGQVNQGIDSLEIFHDVNANFRGIVMTNRIDILASKNDLSNQCE
ncbi:glycerophosphodiester phosphodiesterase [Catenovulum sp. SM1970]|uniref:glycerophosphodiester phosphodiesterase family protein n=1 Tax=Marinifaba aquimaris TaxID=2741323 RepID=UPI001574AD5F|nr:glycerophosphodiester phosphodiesterase family protein [Marinifaba aquimaris]NTS78485.1 glycerophosphodiester phosphodiesterase [Marinifaba aquimaris]